MTYYVNTDIHPFTRQYLKGHAVERPRGVREDVTDDLYHSASTPTLIQHGEFDRRVPIPNAYNSTRVSRMSACPPGSSCTRDFGHGITKPKERLAAVWHNWQWFGKYIWDEDVELPLPEPVSDEAGEKES